MKSTRVITLVLLLAVVAGCWGCGAIYSEQKFFPEPPVRGRIYREFYMPGLVTLTSFRPDYFTFQHNGLMLSVGVKNKVGNLEAWVGRLTTAVEKQNGRVHNIEITCARTHGADPTSGG